VLLAAATRKELKSCGWMPAMISEQGGVLGLSFAPCGSSMSSALLTIYFSLLLYVLNC
jgi:hypothetical protein